MDNAAAEVVFAKIENLASYGFPKWHSVAFALLTYQTAYLKRYFPAEFLCSLLNNQPMGFAAQRSWSTMRSGAASVSWSPTSIRVAPRRPSKAETRFVSAWDDQGNQ